MLLLSIYRLLRVAAIYIVIVAIMMLLADTSFADQIQQANNNKNKQTKTEKKDLLTTQTGKSDLLTSPRNKATTSSNSSKKPEQKNTRGSETKDVATKATPSVVQKKAANTVKQDKNLDVYIGRCPHTVSAVREAKKFLAQNKQYYGQFMMMKTNVDYDVTSDDLKGIEISLPLEASKYNITSVPTFVINVNGVLYKVSGTTDLSDLYKEIVAGKVRGERKDGYIDLGTRGSECKAFIVNLSPKGALTEQDKKMIIALDGRPPNLTALLHQRKIVLPESSAPVVIEKQTGAIKHHGISTYIVFSKSQKAWALEMAKKGAMGCCSDCVDIGDVHSFAQLCTKELLAELNVKSTPTIVLLK